MLIFGSGLSRESLISKFKKARDDKSCIDLDLRDLNIENNDTELSLICIDVIRCKEWESITISVRSFSVGYLPDLAMACMSYNVKSFELQQYSSSRSFTGDGGIGINSCIGHTLAFGIKHSKSLINLALSLQLDDFDNEYSILTLLARAIAQSETIKQLSFAGSRFDETKITSATRSLRFSFRLNRTLERISFDGCHLPDDTIADIVESLHWHPTIKILSLQQNGCHTKGMAAIAGLLHTNRIEDLDLSYLDRPPKKEKKEEKPKKKKEEKKKSEETKSNNDDNKKTTTKPDDKKNEEVKDDGKEDESKEEDKDDEDNDSSDDESDEPKQSVRNTSLKALRMAGNYLSDGYIQSMLNIFTKDSTLEELNLFGNYITDVGILAIIRKLPQLKKLKYLYLGHNPFGYNGCDQLVCMVRDWNKTLEELSIKSLTSDKIKDSMQRKIDHYMRLNQGGRQLFANDSSGHKTPLSLWPFVLERANLSYWNLNSTKSQAADIIFCLLHGPILFENPDLPSSSLLLLSSATTTTTNTNTSSSSLPSPSKTEDEDNNNNNNNNNVEGTSIINTSTKEEEKQELKIEEQENNNDNDNNVEIKNDVSNLPEATTTTTSLNTQKSSKEEEEEKDDNTKSDDNDTNDREVETDTNENILDHLDIFSAASDNTKTTADTTEAGNATNDDNEGCIVQ